MSSENRPLKDYQREFVHNIVNQGMDKVDSYCLVMGINKCRQNIREVTDKAKKELLKPNVNAYYIGLLNEVREKEQGKAIWTRELATEKLIKLAEKAEQEIYENGEKITMSRMNAILQPIKELNLMNGYNQINNKVEGTLVQIFGEDDLLD